MYLVCACLCHGVCSSRRLHLVHLQPNISSWRVWSIPGRTDSWFTGCYLNHASAGPSPDPARRSIPEYQTDAQIVIRLVPPDSKSYTYTVGPIHSVRWYLIHWFAHPNRLLGPGPAWCQHCMLDLHTVTQIVATPGFTSYQQNVHLHQVFFLYWDGQVTCHRGASRYTDQSWPHLRVSAGSNAFGTRSATMMSDLCPGSHLNLGSPKEGRFFALQTVLPSSRMRLGSPLVASRFMKRKQISVLPKWPQDLWKKALIFTILASLQPASTSESCSHWWTMKHWAVCWPYALAALNRALTHSTSAQFTSQQLVHYAVIWWLQLWQSWWYIVIMMTAIT
jgi:hypothetical protein